MRVIHHPQQRGGRQERHQDGERRERRHRRQQRAGARLRLPLRRHAQRRPAGRARPVERQRLLPAQQAGLCAILARGARGRRQARRRRLGHHVLRSGTEPHPSTYFFHDFLISNMWYHATH